MTIVINKRYYCKRSGHMKSITNTITLARRTSIKQAFEKYSTNGCTIIGINY